MEQLPVFVSLVCLILLIVVTAILVQTLKHNRLQQDNALKTLSQTNQKLLESLEKQTNLILSKDPMTFQALQATTSQTYYNEPIDMSDEAEAIRWAEQHPHFLEEGELA